MRAVVQRVSKASVTVDGEVTGSIGHGLLILLAVHQDDTEADVSWLAEKCINLRIFENDEGKFDRSLIDTGGAALVVSQFTLYGDCRKGRRPNFSASARPEKAEALYESFIRELQALHIETAAGRFAAMMDVELINSGPVTLMVDSGVRR